MTLRTSSPRAKPRWLLLLVVVALASLAVVGIAQAVIPDPYVAADVEIDEHGANDVPGQVDVTQMGRSNLDSTVYRIFWSWDSISAWTGSGQTGDACALFDNDGNTFIDFVVCARVSNLNADPTDVRIVEAAAGKPVFLFECTDKKNDRCTQPTPIDYVVGDVAAGILGTLGSGNLVTDTDPFNTGESHPKDTSIDVRIPGGVPPTDSVLVNVCSYPSAGNGGNNNPFDCINTPGQQYGTLVVTKVLTNDNGGTAGITDFSYTVNGGASVSFPAGGSNSTLVPVGNYTVVEDPETGYTASYTNSVNPSNLNCTSLAVTAGGTTTCTITNNDNAPTLTLVKTVTNDNGGSAANTAWTLRANKQGTDTTTYELSGTTGVSSSTLAIGTYDLSETGGPAGYTQTSLTCSDTGSSQVTTVTLSLGESVTCTFVNDDSKAQPAGTTVQSWVLHDTLTITGIRAGGSPTASVTFRLYTSCSGGTPSGLVGSETDNSITAGGVALTTTGIAVTASGDYYWTAQYSGDSYNEGFTTSCSLERTQILAKDAFGGGRDDFAPVP